MFHNLLGRGRELGVCDPAWSLYPGPWQQQRLSMRNLLIQEEWRKILDELGTAEKWLRGSCVRSCKVAYIHDSLIPLQT